MNSALQCNKQRCTINLGSGRLRHGKCHITPIRHVTPTLWSNAEALSQIDNRRLKAQKLLWDQIEGVFESIFTRGHKDMNAVFHGLCWLHFQPHPGALLIMIFPSTGQIPTPPLETPLFISPSANYFYWVQTFMTFDYIPSTQCLLLKPAQSTCISCACTHTQTHTHTNQTLPLQA